MQKRLDHVTNEEKTRKNSSGYGMDRFNSIGQVIAYATNPDKTEKQFYTTGLNCEIKDSVLFKDGKKCYGNLTNTALIRKTSDEICEE